MQHHDATRAHPDARRRNRRTGELLSMRTRQITIHRVLSLFGPTEGVVRRNLSQFKRKFAGQFHARVQIKFPEVHIHLSLSGTCEAQLHRQADLAVAWLVDRFKDRVLSAAGEPMEVVVGNLLARRQATVAVAESCTGGLISHWFTNVAGSSDYFLLGAITYSNQAKIDVIGVSPGTLERHGAVHEETAKEMAAGVRRLAGATYGLATSGIAGPDGGTADKPVGTVCLALAAPQTLVARRHTLDWGDRLKNKKFFAMAALDLLRCTLTADG